MKEQFVPYEIAIKLKEKGFDEPCLAWSTEYGEYILVETKEGEDSNTFRGISIPLWQQVIDWFRVKYNLDVQAFSALTHNDKKPVEWIGWITKIPEINLEANELKADTFEEAREQIILQALTLI